MANATTARPQKVTMACLAAGVASAIVLVSIVTTLSNWGSIEVREQIEDALSAGPVSGAISVDQALGWLRGVLMGAGALSAAAIVLSIWTAKRHRGARIGLTVLAVLSSLAFVVAGATGQQALLDVAIFLALISFLWGRESRAWFAGQTPPETTSQQRRPADPQSSPTPVLPTQKPQAPAPQTPVRAPDPAATGGQPAPAARPYASGPGAVSQPFPPRSSPYAPGADPASYGRTPVPGRPRRLVTAVVVAAVLSGLAAAVFGLNVLLYVASPGQYADLIAEQPMIADSDILGQLGMTAAELARTMFWLSLALALLAVAGAVSALAMLSRLIWETRCRFARFRWVLTFIILN